MLSMKTQMRGEGLAWSGEEVPDEAGAISNHAA
jgi:hypothetical protein